MPFTRYGNIEHRCEKPTKRDDNTPLQVGDEWQCDFEFTRPPGAKPGIYKVLCNKIWRWTDPHDQRDPGCYWKEVPASESRGSYSDPRDGSNYVGPYGMGGGGPYS